MPIIKSAKKRVRVTQKATAKNAKVKKSLRASLKAFQTAVSGKKDSSSSQNAVFSSIDTAVKKGIMSKNKAARKKSRLNAQAKATGATRSTVKKATPNKTVAKKPATKKVAKKKTAKK